MNAVLKILRRLGYEELLSVSDALDAELESRMERTDSFPDSARQRAHSRQQSYRHGNGAAAPPIRYVGLRSSGRQPAAA